MELTIDKLLNAVEQIYDVTFEEMLHPENNQAVHARLHAICALDSQLKLDYSEIADIFDTSTNIVDKIIRNKRSYF